MSFLILSCSCQEFQRGVMGIQRVGVANGGVGTSSQSTMTTT